MSAPENQAGQVDGFSVAVDIVAVVAFLAAFTALLFGANALIACLIEGHPALIEFMLSPWVAPALIGCGVVVLVGIAALLLLGAPQGDGEGGE